MNTKPNSLYSISEKWVLPTQVHDNKFMLNKKNIENIKLFVNTESKAHTNQLYGLVILLLSSTLKHVHEGIFWSWLKQPKY